MIVSTRSIEVCELCLDCASLLDECPAQQFQVGDLHGRRFLVVTVVRTEILPVM